MRLAERNDVRFYAIQKTVEGQQLRREGTGNVDRKEMENKGGRILSELVKEMFLKNFGVVRFRFSLPASRLFRHPFRFPLTRIASRGRRRERGASSGNG